MREGIADVEPPNDLEEPRNAGSIEDLYVRHAPEAVRLASLLTHDPTGAEDLVQEAFIKVAGRFAYLRNPSAFEAYLRRAVVNLCMSQHRHERVARGYLERTSTRSSDPTASLPDIETRDELREALSQLPSRQRTAVILRYYGDLSEQQVADALRCSVTAARSLVFRAMETLRATIGDEP